MPDKIYLHDHPEFKDITLAIADKLGISPYLVQKDYFTMHFQFMMQQIGFDFQLKGGTSLSKAFELTGRFSEDLDVQITPPAELNVKTGKNHDKKESHILSRKNYFDWVVAKLAAAGIEVERDPEFDDIPKYRHGGIRLHFKSDFENDALLVKRGVLLEVGFAKIIPNIPVTMSSWLYDLAVSNGLDTIDNRAKEVSCLVPGYTFVEKLNAIGTKFAYFKRSGKVPKNFVRHYYDIYCLLQDEKIREFIESEEFEEHKKKCFSPKVLDIPLSENQAFLLSDSEDFKILEAEYLSNKPLYYKGQPEFRVVMDTIREWVSRN